MATTTTNFGWDIPQSTDLVKDGATAIATLGQDIDTAFVDLKGGTTGQVLAKASGTDLDFSWVAADDTNAIQNAIVDAKGDLIAATAADTPARLAVGTNGQVLTADSTAATGLKWANAASSGGLTLLSTNTINSGTTTNTITGISTAYKALKIVILNVKMATTGANWAMRFNTDTGNNYVIGWNGAYWAGLDNGVQLTTNFYMGLRTSDKTDWYRQGYAVIDVSNYNAAGQALVEWKAINQDGGTGATYSETNGIGVYNASSAVTSFSLIADTNFSSGTALIYGVN